jgi:hypothetical protein
MATPLTCGENGSTGYEVIARINQLSEPDPRATGGLSAPTDVEVDGNAATVAAIIDEVVTERSGFTVDISNHRLINNSGKNYASVIVSVGINVSFSSDDAFDVWVYKNGTAEASSKFTVRGSADGVPVSAFYQTDIAMENGDYIDIRVKNVGSGTFTCSFENAQIRIDADEEEAIS